MIKIPSGIKTWSARIFTAGLGQFFLFGARFSRNIILARLLAPGEFGTAVAIMATFGLAVATDLGLDRYTMLRGTPQSLSTAHLMSVARGLLVGLVFFTCAPEAAAVFGVPDAFKSFQLIAWISILDGFHHFGVRQIWRDHQYGPDTRAQIVSSIGAVVVIFPAVALLHDHRAVVVSLATEVGLYTLVSQYLAPSSYHLRTGKNQLKDALTFSLPLMLNGVGLAIMQQFDRFFVGYWFGVKELALYAVLLSLSSMPGVFLSSMFANVALSYLIGGKEGDASLVATRYRNLFFMYLLVSLAYLLFTFLTLDIFAPLIFGPSFSVSPVEQATFALLAYFRLMRAGAPTALLLAQSQTRLLAYVNLSAAIGFLAGALAMVVKQDMGSMLIGFAVGEVITSLLFLIAVKQRITTANVGSSLAQLLAVPLILVGAFAMMPEAMIANRAFIFAVGIVAISTQFCYQLFSDIQFRSLFLHTAVADVTD